MIPPDPHKTHQPLVVWWILWTAFFVGLVQIYYFLEPTVPARPLSGNPLTATLGLLPVAASIVIRWAVLPRISDSRKAFLFFIAGIALAEATCFFGLFLFPAYKDALLGFSLLGIVQFAPSFARRFA